MTVEQQRSCSDWIVRALTVQEDAFRLHLRSLEIDHERHVQAGNLQVTDPLRQMLVGNALHTLQFQDKLLLNNEVGEILAHVPAFVADPKWDLSLCLHATQRQFPEQCPFI